MSLRSPPCEPRLLLLPGWLDSGPGHWQSRWEVVRGCERVEQSDWLWPRRGDWMARLDEVLLDDLRPAVLVAHSLGCHLVAAWSATSRHVERVRSALLVAPPDLERADLPPPLAAWCPPVRTPLAFPSLLAYSDDDPFSSTAASRSLARDWAATPWALGRCGHVNADSGLGDWPEGLRRLDELRTKGA